MDNLVLPIASLLVALALSLIITRVATMALMLTGLSRESARFQARSAFTGVGFTTTEAESVTNHPVRRHIVMALMLLGNVGIATLIASLMLTMLQAGREENPGDLTKGLGLLAAGLFLIWVASSSRWVERQLNRPIAYALQRFTHLDVRDYVSLLELASGFTVSEINVEPEDWVADRTLQELGLAREGILVLGIRHTDGHYVGAPSGTSQICGHDTLVIYGPGDRIEEIDTRCRGAEGDAAHLAATEEYQDYLTGVRIEETIRINPSS